MISLPTAPVRIPVVLLYNLDPDWTPEEKKEAFKLTEELAGALKGFGHAVELVRVEGNEIHGKLRPYDPNEYLIFNWCEGIPGIEHSEWLVARQLEELGYTYTGASPRVLSLAQDKQRVKDILEACGIPTPAWKIFDAPRADSWRIFPAIVKPRNEHCSAGITPESVVTNGGDLTGRIAFILNRYAQPALVEDFIDGREFHVAVLGNEDLTVLPAAEMDFSRFGDARDRLCTYEAKFAPGSLHYEKIETLLPAPLTGEEKETLEEICRKAYRAVGCRDYARMDLRLRDGVFYVLDVNPNADLSSDASMACAAEAAGMSYAQLGSVIVRMAAARHPVFRQWL
ncbi:MAG TPA: ATP-grasp domain-containing protein [Smithella sp.]|nr:ATP-grasp domain-containing protein [Smithella sp.]HRS96825.1 ATP-grasp domain-containing protein [Smithella sp.]